MTETVALALDKRADRSLLRAAIWWPSQRVREAEVYERVFIYLDLFGLERWYDTQVQDLSVGVRRTLEIACQMAAEPKVLLLDEPSGGLAESEVDALAPMLRRLAHETGCGIVMIEHNEKLVSQLADRVVVLDLGRVLDTATTEGELS